jgi:hypothetical protein
MLYTRPSKAVVEQVRLAAKALIAESDELDITRAENESVLFESIIADIDETQEAISELATNMFNWVKNQSHMTSEDIDVVCNAPIEEEERHYCNRPLGV